VPAAAACELKRCLVPVLVVVRSGSRRSAGRGWGWAAVLAWDARKARGKLRGNSTSALEVVGPMDHGRLMGAPALPSSSSPVLYTTAPMHHRRGWNFGAIPQP